MHLSHTSRWLTGGLVLAGLLACNETPTATSSPVTQTPMPNRSHAATFSMRIDPASGTATIIGGSARGLHVPATVVQDGNPNANPGESFQLVTTDARLPGEDTVPPGNVCPADQNCFDVRLDSFLTRSAAELTLVIDGSSPSRTLANSDMAPAGSGLSSPFGMTTFGDLAAGGSSTREMRFVIPNLDPFTVTLSLWEQGAGPATAECVRVSADDCSSAEECALGPPQCSGGGSLCFRRVEGEARCTPENSCNEACATDADCGAGRFCGSTCCGQTCFALCN